MTTERLRTDDQPHNSTARILPSKYFVRFHLPRFTLVRRLLDGRPRLLVATIVVLAVTGFAAAGWLTWFSYDLTNGLPNRDALRGLGDMSQATTLFDAGDRPAFTIFKEQRIEVPLSRVSPNLIKAVMSVEDQRFFEHSGIDAVRVARRRLQERAARPARRGRQHHHAAARPTELPHARQDVSPQAEGNHPRRAHREPLHQGGDSRAVPEQGLLRRRSVRRRGGLARLLRQHRRRPDRRSGGAAGGPDPVALVAMRRPSTWIARSPGATSCCRRWCRPARSTRRRRRARRRRRSS